MHCRGALAIVLLHPHRPRPLRPWSCPKTLALVGGQTPASCSRTVMCQWHRAAAVALAAVTREAPELVESVTAQVAVPVAAQARAEAAVVASPTAP